MSECHSSVPLNHDMVGWWRARREAVKLKEARDAGRAAERERVRVAEEVAIRTETELGAVKQKCAQVKPGRGPGGLLMQCSV